MRRALTVIVAALMAITGLILVAPGIADAAAGDQSGQGVTPTSIKVGITYLDAAAIKNIVNIDPGNYQVAYTALIKQINAKGGINGRKLVPVFEPINPIGTAPAATACTCAHRGRQGVRRHRFLPARRHRLLRKYPRHADPRRNVDQFGVGPGQGTMVQQRHV